MKIELIMSGKGGVGKTTIAFNVARALAMSEKRVGILDADLTSSSVLKLIGIDPTVPKVGRTSVAPLDYGGMKLMSVSMFTGSEETPVFFRGEKKRSWIDQFVFKVEWGDLDYLVVDCPPGHSDEVIEILTTLRDKVHKVVIVSTPDRLALNSVQKTIKLCQKLRVPILGIVENRYAVECPECKRKIKFAEETFINQLSNKFGVPIIARVPLMLDQENNPVAIHEYVKPVADEIMKRKLW